MGQFIRVTIFVYGVVLLEPWSLWGECETGEREMHCTAKYLLKHYSFYLGGDQPHVDWVERNLSVLGAFIGLVLALTIDKFLGEVGGIDEWLVASLGAMLYWYLRC